MDENSYPTLPESPDEPLLELEPEPRPRPPIALRIKRVSQVITLGCAVLVFLLNAKVLPPQQPIVVQLLFGGAMFGLLVILGCNYFIRSKPRRPTAGHRLKLK